MLTAKRLRGTPVIDVEAGKQLGTADLVLFSPEERRLLGFVMENGGVLTKDRQVVRAEDVRAIGPDAITIEGAASVRQLDEADQPFQEAVSKGQRLFGMQVVTESGRALGTVEDLFLDDSARRVTSVGVKSGSSTDAVPIERLVSVGPDAVIVSDTPVDGTGTD